MTTFSETVERLGPPHAYFPALVQVTGSLASTVFLSQLLYWQGRGSLEGGWIYKSQADMQAETGLTRREQDRARRELRALGIIEERRAGVPATMHYRINREALDNVCQSSLYGCAKLDCTDRTNKSVQMCQSTSKTTAQTTAKTTTHKRREPTVQKRAYADHVTLTEIEHGKLVEVHGAATVTEYIRRLSEYKFATGREYSSDYLTILNWIRRDTEKAQAQPDRPPETRAYKTAEQLRAEGALV